MIYEWRCLNKDAGGVADAPPSREEAVMPGGDRTGPQGNGPMTGWGSGYCSRGPGGGPVGAGGGVSRGGFGAGGFGAGRSAGWRFAMGAGRLFGRCFTGGWGHGRRNRFLATGVPGWGWRQDSARVDADAGAGSGSTNE